MTKLLKVYRLSQTSISFSQRLYSAVYSVAKWRMRDVRDYHRVVTDRVVRMRDYHPVADYHPVVTMAPVQCNNSIRSLTETPF